MNNDIISAADITYEPDLSALEQSILCRSFGDKHLGLLQRSNGLHLFGMGLHIFGVGPVVPEFHDVNRWNDSELWKHEYRELVQGRVFFAESIFGDQYFYGEGGDINKFLAETGHSYSVAVSFSEWTEKLFSNSEDLLELDVLRRWQADASAEIQPGQHLCPRIPFCLGGKIETAQDGYLCAAADDMRFKGQLACQLKKLRPGDKVDLKVINMPPAR